MNRKGVVQTKLAALAMAVIGLGCLGIGMPVPALAQTPQAPQTDPKHAPAEKIEPCPDQHAGSLSCDGKSRTQTPPTVKKAPPKHRVQQNSPQHTPPRHTSPGHAATKPSNGNLSKELQQSHGAIKPPGTVDPGMVATPPRHGGDQNMPVIPPPGTPGGNPHVVPQ
ncbi:MAG TPA: hypothetical protein VL574_06740 [Stellaceae bacterium]|nr:hypothetical protein [Stellaceae bacterium]